MDAVDITVLRALKAWREAGEDALLVTVVKTWGSSPRPVGSMLAVRVGVEMVGSVSGGCIEDDVFQRFADIRDMPATTLLRYGVSAEEAHRFGLPCGGTIELMVECNPSLQSIDALLTQLDAGMLVQRRVDRASGSVELEPVKAYVPLQLTEQAMSLCIGPRWRMLLIGAGVLAQYLTTIAHSTGFAVTVCDPRSEHSFSWDESLAPLMRCMPDDAVQAFKPDYSSCIVTLSHDPKLDDLAILEALGSPAFYVGAIGSRRNNEARRARLMEHFDVSPAVMQRLRGPIGLFIDSKTPAEIAVSIMAEIIAVKNGVPLLPEMQVCAGKALHELRARADA